MDGQVDPRPGPGSTGSYSRRHHRASAQDWFGEQRSPTERPNNTIDQFLDRPVVEQPSRIIRTPESWTLLANSSHSNHRSPSSAPPMNNHDRGHKDGQWDRRGSFPGAGQGNSDGYRAPPKYARNEDRRHPYHGNGNHSAPRHSLTSTNASLDPRRMGRKEAGRLPSLNTEQNPPGRPESFGLRSGSQTPMTPQSLGSPQEDRIKELTVALEEFTSHVTSMASLNIQRDIAKKEYEKREQDYQMSRKYHAAFATLAEQQENSKVNAKKKFEVLDQQLKNHVAARETLSTAIASKVISHSNSKDTETLRHFQFEIQDMSKRVKDTYSEICQIKSVQTKVTEQGSLLSSIQGELDKIRPALAFVDSLVPKLDKLENRVDDFPNLRMELSKIRDELRPISKSIDKAMANFERLSQTVEGEKHGLAQAVKQLEAKIAEYADALDKLDLDQHHADGELDQHHARILALETRLNANMGQAVSDAQHGPATSGVRSSDAARLEADLEAFRAEQQTRDEMVAEEIDKTQKGVSKLESDFKNFEREIDKIQKGVQKLENDFKNTEVEIEQINGWIVDRSQGRLSIVDRRPSTTGDVEHEAKPALTETSTSNGTQINPEMDQEIKKLKEELQQQQNSQSEFRHQLDGFKYSIEILDMRFNKLTTEHLARYMVGQMSKLYPQASVILASFEQSRQFQESMQTKIQDLADRLEKIGLEQQQRAAATLPAPTAPTTNGPNHEDTYSKAETDQMIGELRSYVLEMIELSKSTAKHMNELKLRVNSIWDSTAKEFGTLFVQVEALKEQQTDGGSNAAGGTSTRPTSEGTSAGTGQGQNAPARKASTTATSTPASCSHSPPTRQQSVSNNTNGGTKSTPSITTKPIGKRRGRKRKRNVISESESDWKQDANRFEEDDGGGSGSH